MTTNINSVAPAAFTLSTVDTDSNLSTAEQVQVKVGGEVSQAFNLTTTEGQKAFADFAASNNVSVSGLTAQTGGSDFVASLPQELKTMMAGISSSIAGMNTAQTGVASSSDLQGRWSEFAGKVAQTGNIDVNALVQSVLRDSYMENTKDLHFYAQKVKFYNELKKGIRDELTDARKALSHTAGADAESALPSTFDYKTLVTGPNADGEVIPPQSGNTDYDQTKEGLETYIKNLEEQLNSVGDDAQLANVDLQNMLQKQQQTMQQMSNISKMLHDTAMAVIRKIG